MTHFEVRTPLTPKQADTHNADAPGGGPDFLRRVRFLRLRASQQALAGAAAAAGLALAEARQVEAAAQGVSRRIAPPSARAAGAGALHAEGDQPEAAVPPIPALVMHVSRPEWELLLAIAGKVPDSARGRGSRGRPLDWLDFKGRPLNWLDTIGKRRQILAFHPNHMEWVCDFVEAMGLTQELALVYRSPPHPWIERAWVRYDIQAMTQDTVTWAAGGKPLQLDVAQSDDGHNTHPHRQALVRRRGARTTLTSYGLLVLWLCWRVEAAR